MNGLLHRVAARAAGTAVAVRSEAGSPYAAGGSGQGDMGEAEAPIAPAAAPREPMQSVSARHQIDRSTGVVESVEAPPVIEGVRAPSVRVAARTDATVLRDTSTIGPKAAVAPRVGSTQASAFAEPQATMPLLHAAPPMPRPALAAIEPEPEAARAPREIAITARAAMRAADPAPLMPREALPAPLAPVPQPMTRRGALPQGIAATQSEADTEVHIHIGRIDVTAVHEAAPPRRRAVAAPAPMSLDGYLAQRGRA